MRGSKPHCGLEFVDFCCFLSEKYERGETVLCFPSKGSGLLFVLGLYLAKGLMLCTQ
jgi:hypothetical protein